MTVCETITARAVATDIAVVVVEMVGMGRALTGSALLDVRPEDAFARASLDAINRIVTDPRLLDAAKRNAAMGVG